MICRIYGLFHKSTKKLLGRPLPGDGSQFFYTYHHGYYPMISGVTDASRINGETVKDGSFSPDRLFYGENTANGCLAISEDTWDWERVWFEKAEYAWRRFVKCAEVPDGWRNSGFLLCGYIKEKKNWCLSSWIWTSAAAARYYAKIGDAQICCRIADAFLREQLSNGGWVVRYDYPAGKTMQVVAPNDSAYIANNALLSTWRVSGDEKYLSAACRCADWIISTARDDGLVWISMDNQSGMWKKDSNIVDIGFTAGLFAELYVQTKDEAYRTFGLQFLKTYIRLFWDADKGFFHTSLNANDQPVGGYFARGQAWALEGLIPAYEVFHDDRLEKVIRTLVASLKRTQNQKGGWAYNFARPLMGEDCKGVPLIARALWDWRRVSGDTAVDECVKKAYQWCVAHTALSGECAGGIFSHSTEGAVVHDLYTETAFVYSSAYALELAVMMGDMH